jgi:hypothetical protein
MPAIRLGRHAGKQSPVPLPAAPSPLLPPLSACSGCCAGGRAGGQAGGRAGTFPNMPVTGPPGGAIRRPCAEPAPGRPVTADSAGPAATPLLAARPQPRRAAAGRRRGGPAASPVAAAAVSRGNSLAPAHSAGGGPLWYGGPAEKPVGGGGGAGLERRRGVGGAEAAGRVAEVGWEGAGRRRQGMGGCVWNGGRAGERVRGEAERACRLRLCGDW